MLRLGRSLWLVITVLAILLVNVPANNNASFLTQAANNSSCLLTWHTVSTPERLWNDIAAVSQADIWVVGNAILHWDGSSWNLVQDSYLNNNTLLDVAVISANDIWAAGWGSDGSSSHTLVMHWDGKEWSSVAVPDIGAAFGVDAISTTSIWIIGNVENSNPVPTSLHWDGAAWQTIPMSFSVPIARYGWVRGISAIAEDDVWAVGEFYGRPSELSDVLVWHWDGTQWDHKPIGMGWLAQFTAVAAVSSNDVWAVGKRAPDEAIIAHWNGTQWSLVSSYPNGILNAVAGLSANDAWAVGWYETENSQQMLIEQWDGIRWDVVNLPKQPGIANGLGGVTALSAADVWAVGSVGVLHGTLPCVTTLPHKPIPISPRNGANTAKTAVRLKWEPAIDAAWYELYVKKGTKLVIQETNLANTRYLTKPLKRGSTYTWRVKACNSVGCRASRWWSFTILE